MAIAEVCRPHRITSATFYKWKSKYGGLDVPQARRQRSLDEENSRLKKLLAEALLENAVVKVASQKMVTPGAKREAVAYAREHREVSERRAYCLVGVSGKVVRHEPKRPKAGVVHAQAHSAA